MAALLSYALCTLSDVKESLGIESGVTKYDNLIIRKINQATLAIENYCGRRFASTIYTNELYDATNIDELILRQRPIISIEAFEVRDTSQNSNDWEAIDSELYHQDANAGVLELLFRASGRWNQYRVSYTAGYSTIPADLAEACASLACFYFNSASAVDVGVSAKREGGRSIQYTTATQDFKGVLASLGIDNIIESYANYPILTDR